MSGRPLILYHDDCIDGFGAAWAAWRKFGDEGEYLPVMHGNPPPEVIGRQVYILDFSYKRDVLMEMAGQAASLQVVDHHKSAQENLAGLDYCLFDMSHSGCVLAWKFFHPGAPVPELLSYVEDKDLWTWKLPAAREITSALRGHPFAFSRWLEWAEDWDKWREVLHREGEAILRYQDGVVETVAAGAAPVNIAGYMVPCVNTPILQSEIAGKLAEGQPFGVAWYEADGKRYYSLRVRDSDVDVSQVARLFGGGGHPKASGFSVDAAVVDLSDPDKL